ncbi:tRNA pseudouridine(38-40) synthase TruA [Jatrophihabitans sp.]|uniref:tRNA pseudouridine(38-40) synthase TruA n=1 Tax=Jatrophihabitans sp. TaxID=1932789 RepID=UPI0030C77CAA|nr:tRNA pseudouridine synthase [Jatrophihabitans sp.]
MPTAGPSLGAFNRLRLDIAYDGTDFAGWAVQPGQRTVQGVLQESLAAVLRTPVALTVAGRTDSGVHALGQVAHCDVPAALWEAVASSLLRRLAGVLPADVRVLRVGVVPAEFDARFAALWRRYEYRISDRPAGVDPLRRHIVLDHRRALDVALMAEAAARLVGLHDFVAFCRRREGATTTRCVQSFTVAREGAEIVVRIQADAFCHSMVRSLVGSLIAVGEGLRAPEWPASLLTAAERANTVRVAGPEGLTLVEVGYPPDSELAARSLQTRARR